MVLGGEESRRASGASRSAGSRAFRAARRPPCWPRRRVRGHTSAQAGGIEGAAAQRCNRRPRAAALPKKETAAFSSHPSATRRARPTPSPRTWRRSGCRTGLWVTLRVCVYMGCVSQTGQPIRLAPAASPPRSRVTPAAAAPPRPPSPADQPVGRPPPPRAPHDGPARRPRVHWGWSKWLGGLRWPPGGRRGRGLGTGRDGRHGPSLPRPP